MPVFRNCFLSIAVVVSAAVSLWSQVNQPTSALEIDGRAGRAEVIQKNGRPYVDLRSLVEMTGGSLSFKPGLIVLTFPLANSESHAAPAPEPTETRSPNDQELSREFARTGIEAIATMREWASTLAYAIENNYTVTDDWIAKYREQAQHNLRLASSASSTTADHNGLQLLTNEFEAVRRWSDQLLQARKSMNTAKYAMSAGTLRNEELSQKIITCGRFLASMFGSASYMDDPSCH